MGRSVNIPTNAIAVVTLSDPAGAADPTVDYDVGLENWCWFLDGVREAVRKALPDFGSADAWPEREEHVVAQSPAFSAVVCEYNGVVTVSLVPRDTTDFDELSEDEIGATRDTFRVALTRLFAGHVLTKLGTASNGETFYRRA